MANKYHVLKVHQIKNKNMQKNDTYSPHMDFVISLIFYFTTAFFWAITFGNPSINDWTALIWNYQIKNKNMQKNDTYSPHMDFVISLIFYFTTAFFWAITFGNPSINDGMAAIWN